MSEATSEATNSEQTTWPLCAYSEVENNSAKGVSLKGVNSKGEVDSVPLIVVRWEDKVHAYVNNCPHTPTQLDGSHPGQFFNEDKSFLMCDKHGATFQIDSGECFEGPCQGRVLTKLPCEVINDQICLTGVKLVDAEDA